MKSKINYDLYDDLENLVHCYPMLEVVCDEIKSAYEKMAACYSQGGKLLIAGNGGSCSDAQHMVGELMKGFRNMRPLPEKEQDNLSRIDDPFGKKLAQNLQCALPAIALDGHTSLLTALANDIDMIYAYAQQIYAYGKAGDVFVAISTSGNSENIICAAIAAKARDMQVIALTADKGGALRSFADVSVCVPVKECWRAQELHVPIYHCWCLMLEKQFFGE